MEDNIEGGTDKDAIVAIGYNAEGATTVPADDRLYLQQISANTFTVKRFDRKTGDQTGEFKFTTPGDVEYVSMDGLKGNDLLEADPGVTRNVMLFGSQGNDLLIGGRHGPFVRRRWQ